MTQVDLNGTTLEYDETGEGDPVVLVHGSASDLRTWHRQRDALSDHFRVLTYSRRYHWPNAPIPEGADYAMADHVSDLAALLRSLDATPAHLVGHSYGALVALLLAAQEPSLVCSLVLAEPPAITLFVSNKPTPWEILKLLLTRPRTAVGIVQLGVRGLGPAAAAAERGDMEEAMVLFGTAALGPGAFARLSEARKDQVRANLIKAEFLGSGFPPLDPARLRHVDVPTLLVTGDGSPPVLHRLADALQEILPAVERVEIPGAAHIMHEDNAGTYNAAVRSFVERHPCGA